MAPLSLLTAGVLSSVWPHGLEPEGQQVNVFHSHSSSPRGSSLLTWAPAHHTLRPLLLSHPSPSSPMSLISSQAQISAFHSLVRPRPAPWPCSCSDGTVWPGRPAPGWPPRAAPLSPGSARQHSPQHCTMSVLPLGRWDRPTAASSGLAC